MGWEEGQTPRSREQGRGPGEDPHQEAQLISDKGEKVIQWMKNNLFTR